MASLDIIPTPSRRHPLSPKSLKRAFGATTGQSCSVTSAKRPATNDENCDPARGYSSPRKRTKSVLGNATNTFAWDDKVRIWGDENAMPGGKPATPRFALVEKKSSSSLRSIANSLASTASSVKSLPDSLPLKSSINNMNGNHNVTIGKRSCNVSVGTSKPRISSPLRRPLSRHSPPRLSPPRSRKRNFSRIDPPSSLRSSSTSSSSIDEILQRASSPFSFDNGYSLSSDESEGGGVPLIVTGLDRDYAMPDSWNFAIYEDSPEEALQNLMEHSTGTLDISDDSDDDLCMDEILHKGKENIPPARLQELLAANREKENTTEPPRPARRVAASTAAPTKIRKGNREVLGGLRVEDFYPQEERIAAAKKFNPVVKKAPIDFISGYPSSLELVDVDDDFSFYRKRQQQLAPPIEIWESESAKEESEDEGEDGGVRLLRSRASSPVKEIPSSFRKGDLN